jgi:hypothetical protein
MGHATMSTGRESRACTFQSPPIGAITPTRVVHLHRDEAHEDDHAKQKIPKNKKRKRICASKQRA